MSILLEALDQLSHKTTNNIDDTVVHMLKDNEEIIIEQIKELL